MALAAPGQDKVVGGALVIIEKTVFDDVGPVSEARDEVLVPKVGVILHHMPENRAVAEFDHRLGNGFRIIAKTHSKTTTEEDNFHEILLELKKDRGG
jgi:hypothetical protein